MADPFAGTPEKLPQEILPTEESPVEADERAFEAANEQEDEANFLEKAAPEKAPVTQLPGTPAKPVAQTAVVRPKDEATLSVEKILEEGLGSLYATLPEEARPKFKQKGEEAATEISGMVRSLRFQTKRALQLIRDWLLTIPGVNKFFLEQEAKIKVDLLANLVAAKIEAQSK